MGFIERAYDSLVEHLLELGLKRKRDDFTLIDSITDIERQDKISLFLLGVMLDRSKTQNGAIYKKNRKYEVAHNSFEIFFAIKLPVGWLDDMSLIMRILSDFEQMKDAKLRLLNSSKELQDNLIVREFLRQNGSTNAIFVKVTAVEESLKEVPVKVPVSDVKIKIDKRN